MHDFHYKDLETYLVQPTLTEALKKQNASGASASAEGPKSPPSLDADAAAQMAGELFGDPSLAKTDDFIAGKQSAET
jgi:hypothetical protein